MRNFDHDTLIIGAGMSGIGAAIRLAMFEKDVLVVEKHTIAGGLNSFYAQKGHLLDVGLHALTNFAKKGERNRPLTKILKQLRIKHSELKLDEQSFSKIKYPNKELEFTNDIEKLKTDIAQTYPGEEVSFQNFLNFLETFNETALDLEYESAREKLATFFNNEELIDMLICPLLIYGSAWEMDMDFAQFVIMFKALYVEGFSRPRGGVRTIIRLLLKKYKELGGKVKYRQQVTSLQNYKEGVLATFANGDEIYVRQVISSIGGPETYRFCKQDVQKPEPKAGRMTFTESILFFDKKPYDVNIDETIVFYNENDRYQYREPAELYDDKSAVICFPNNFHRENPEEFDQGIIRLTFMANYAKWKDLKTNHPEEYFRQKENVLKSSMELIKKNYPQFDGNLTFHDVFTPTTIEHYTGHINGCVYGSTEKLRNGKTDFPNIYICGTDQGFLGIVGALLSGISIANLYGLQPTTTSEQVTPQSTPTMEFQL
jgi:phytoene dehydrogenase-like protein